MKPRFHHKLAYGLTDRGGELSEALDHLYELAGRWYGSDGEDAVF